jgi:predicted nucleic acid-binding protein
MNVMIDLNVFLDLFQERLPHYHDSSQVLSKVLNKEITGVIAGHSLTTLFYLTSKSSGKEKALEMVDWVLSNFEVESAGKEGFRQARTFDMKDYEDAVVATCARNADCDYIVTRNTSDFKNSPILSVTPGDFLEIIE